MCRVVVERSVVVCRELLLVLRCVCVRCVGVRLREAPKRPRRRRGGIIGRHVGSGRGRVVPPRKHTTRRHVRVRYKAVRRRGRIVLLRLRRWIVMVVLLLLLLLRGLLRGLRGRWRRKGPMRRSRAPVTRPRLSPAVDAARHPRSGAPRRTTGCVGSGPSKPLLRRRGASLLKRPPTVAGGGRKRGPRRRGSGDSRCGVRPSWTSYTSSGRSRAQGHTRRKEGVTGGLCERRRCPCSCPSCCCCCCSGLRRRQGENKRGKLNHRVPLQRHAERCGHHSGEGSSSRGGGSQCSSWGGVRCSSVGNATRTAATGAHVCAHARCSSRSSS